MSERTSVSWLKTRLQLAAGWSQKQLGQHFLIDVDVIGATLKAAELSSGENVIEIGPGMGVLSEALLGQNVALTAFELDPLMQQILAEDLPGLSIVAGDALKTIPVFLAQQSAGYSYKVVANIPYQITTPLLELFLQSPLLEGRRPVSLTLLIQKEVAERLAAGAKEKQRSFLSILSEYYSTIQIVCQVPPTSFWPAPAVDSAVVHMTLRTSRRYAGEQERVFIKFVRSLCAQRRKQLKNVYAGIRGVSPEKLLTIFKQCEVSPTARAQELTLEQWFALFESGA